MTENYPCDLCIQDDQLTKARVFCVECKQFYCKECSPTHKRIDTTSRHKVEQLKEAISDDGQTNSDALVSTRRFTRSYNDIEAVYTGCINITAPNDDDPALITGLEFLQDGRILLADLLNSKLKLFNKESKLVSELKLRSEPSTAIVIKDSIVVVSLLLESGLQKVKLQSNNTLTLAGRIKSILSFRRLVQFKGHVLAIAFANEEMVCCLSRPNIHFKLVIIDETGKVLETLRSETSTDSEGFLSEVTNMAVSKDDTMVYLAAGDKCIALSEDGEVIFTFVEETKTQIGGVCTDSEGFVYLSCQRNKVIMLSDKGEKIKGVIEVPLRGIQDDFIKSLAFCKTSRKLFIEWEHRAVVSKLLVYRIRY